MDGLFRPPAVPRASDAEAFNHLHMTTYVRELHHIACPSCGTELAVVLEDELTEITGPCGFKFLAAHPDVGKKKKAKPKGPPPPPLSLALLDQGDDVTSSAVIAAFAKNAAFKAFSKAEMEGIMGRDAEDDEKLAAGIRAAIKKGAVAAKPPVEPLTKIDVLGKSADDVALEIVAALGDAPAKGCVLVLQGLSGTGKGTTVDKLKRMLPNASTWSNGNIFRALTLLAVTYCEGRGIEFTPEVLTPALLAELIGMLKFERVSTVTSPGKPPTFDVRIEGLGIKAMVSSVANTLLKEPKVGKNIPTVAKVTQGEVISFAAKCAETMRKAGCNVLMEGRAQTLNYVRTPHRFELTLSKPLLIGNRRAAQRMVAAAATAIKSKSVGKVMPAPTEEECLAELEKALDSLAVVDVK